MGTALKGKREEGWVDRYFFYKDFKGQGMEIMIVISYYVFGWGGFFSFFFWASIDR